METTDKTKNPAKGLSVFVIIIGILMIIMGCLVYGITSVQLSAQGIKVAAVTPEDPGFFAGKTLDGPLEALAEINAIQVHTAKATGDKTYAELGNVATSDGETYRSNVTLANSTDGQIHNAGDPLSTVDAATYKARILAQTASFLQASLFVSVLAFGVSIFIALMGVVVGLIGVNLHMIAKRMFLPQPAHTSAKSS